jgi:alpha/beta superfamily hydrolase
MIQGRVGLLETILEYDPGHAVEYTAMICHPHPLYGGTMHNKVVFRAAKAALREGLPTLRFNFRGAGRSQGEFGNGVGETDDVRAALDNLSSRYPRTPVILMGFSFGLGVGLRVGAEDPRVVALVGLGLAVNRHDYSFLRKCHKPKLFVQGTEDEFGPRHEVQVIVAAFPPPKKLHWVEGVDHFFTGKLHELERVIGSFIREVTSAAGVGVAHLGEGG